MRERERRWLLRAAPDVSGAPRVDITDRYFVGTRLRLRRVIDDGAVVHKLAQKVPAEPPAWGLITNLYLTAEEYELLARLGGAVLRKARYRVAPFSIDVFEPPLDGLVIAEAEFSTDEETASCPEPPLAVGEITFDDRFTGGRLAQMDRHELAAALAGLGVGLG